MSQHCRRLCSQTVQGVHGHPSLSLYRDTRPPCPPRTTHPKRSATGSQHLVANLGVPLIEVPSPRQSRLVRSRPLISRASTATPIGSESQKCFGATKRLCRKATVSSSNRRIPPNHTFQPNQDLRAESLHQQHPPIKFVSLWEVFSWRLESLTSSAASLVSTFGAIGLAFGCHPFCGNSPLGSR